MERWRGGGKCRTGEGLWKGGGGLVQSTPISSGKALKGCKSVSQPASQSVNQVIEERRGRERVRLTKQNMKFCRTKANKQANKQTRKKLDIPPPIMNVM